MKFGIEIETISKLNINDISISISELIGEDRVDLLNHSYHSHDINKWGVERDVSLKPSNLYPYAMEIITPPLRIHELGELKTVMNTLSSKITANSSCGLHVHVEVKEINTVKNILRIWRKFEDQIIQVFAVSRKDNGFCNRINKISPQKMFGMKYGRRYMVNCTPWTARSTIEFRGHNGTTNYIKIKRWVLFCLSLVKKAMETDEETITRQLRKQNLDLWNFLNENGKTKKYFEGRKKHFLKEVQQCAV